ncbi:MAG: HD domain-containing protein [Spirochaetota bacterium]|nr:HD domain-containing protein [Spirochaetota bacterium]
MLKLTVRQLKEGTVFSEPLLSEDGEVLLKKGLPIKKDDIIRWGSLGFINVFSQGEIISGPQIGSELDQIRKELSEKKDGATSKDSELNVAYATKAELQKAKIYEQKLACLELIESIADNLSLGLNMFLQKPDQINAFREKLILSSESVVKAMRNHPEYYLEIISYVETGNTFVSHSIRVAIIGVFLGIQLDSNFKRLLTIAMTAFLHDIGKVAYPIVNDREGIKISKDKMNIQLTHPVYGYKVAKNFLKVQEECAQAILNHHEQPDGKGFPRRITDIKLFITDKIIYLSNVFAHLLEKNHFEGYVTPLKNMDYLLKSFPEKFDHRIAQKLNELKALGSNILTQTVPTIKESVVNS